MTKSWGSPRLVLFLTVLPVLMLAASVLGVAWFCRTLLEEAERVDMDLPSLLPLLLGVFGICLVSCILVVTHGVRLQRRLAGPTLRVIAGMQRVRVGDLSFRVHLRRRDYLSEVAFEFNKVIDWLNENPPEGVRTGSDVVDVYAPHLDDHVDPELDEFDFDIDNDTDADTDNEIDIGDGDDIDLELDEDEFEAELREFDRELEAFDLEPGKNPEAEPEAPEEEEERVR